MASALADVGHLHEKIAGELALDAETVPPVLGIRALLQRDVSRRVAEVGGQTQTRTIRLQKLQARDRIAQVRLKREPVVARDRHGRASGIADAVDGGSNAGDTLNLERRDKKS